MYASDSTLLHVLDSIYLSGPSQVSPRLLAQPSPSMVMSAQQVLVPVVDFREGDLQLQSNAADLLGPPPDTRKTYIMVTLPSEVGFQLQH